MASESSSLSSSFKKMLNRCLISSASSFDPTNPKTSTFPRVRPHLPMRGMLRLPPPPPGKLAASPGLTFLSNPMGPCAVPQAMCWFLMNTVERVMAVCASSIPLAFATVVRVRYVSTANGTAAQRPNRVRRASCSIPWRWDRLRCSGETGTDDTCGGRVSTCTASAWTSR